MNTTLDSRPGPPVSSPSRSAAAARGPVRRSRAVDRLRVSPPCPVAQNGQAIPQPAWLEMHTVVAVRVAHQHAFDQRPVAPHATASCGWCRCRNATCRTGVASSGSSAATSRSRRAAGRSVIAAGSVLSRGEVVPGQLVGAERRPPSSVTTADAGRGRGRRGGAAASSARSLEHQGQRSHVNLQWPTVGSRRRCRR